MHRRPRDHREARAADELPLVRREFRREQLGEPGIAVQIGGMVDDLPRIEIVRPVARLGGGHLLRLVSERGEKPRLAPAGPPQRERPRVVLLQCPCHRPQHRIGNAEGTIGLDAEPRHAGTVLGRGQAVEMRDDPLGVPVGRGVRHRCLFARAAVSARDGRAATRCPTGCHPSPARPCRTGRPAR